jgi:hypothetical protein
MSTSLVASTVSSQASGTPDQVVAQAVLDGIVTETKLAAQAVSEAKLKASAVTNTKIADDAISSPKIVAGGIQAVNLAAESVQAGKIAASAVTAEKIAALTITSDKVAANAITAGKIAAGSITATHLVSELVLATTLVAGNPTGARIVINTGGIEGFRANGTRVLDFDNATGDMTIAGRYRSADSGSRVEINPAGTAPDEIRFYQTSSNYGFILAEPAVGGEAAVRGRSEIVSNRYGSFGCYPGEAYIGNFYNPTGAASSAASSIGSAFNTWGYVTNTARIKSSTAVPSDGGPPRNSFHELNNPYESAISATVLEFKTKTANGTEPMFVAPSRGSGMVFGVGHIYFTDGAGNGSIVVHGTSFVNESGIQSKTDIKDLGFKARDKVKVAKVKRWKRPGDKAPQERVALPPRTPLPGHPAPPIEWVDPPNLPPLIEHIGPMAEDMPPEVLIYDPEYPDRPGINIAAHVSLVHSAVGDLIDEIDALTVRLAALEARFPRDPAPPPPPAPKP